MYSGRLTEGCVFKTPRLQCYVGFDEVRKKLDIVPLLSCQKICHLLIGMLQGDRLTEAITIKLSMWEIQKVTAYA